MKHTSTTDKTSEWVGAWSAGMPKSGDSSNKTFTPSERELRYVERTKRKEAQALDEKFATVSAIGTPMITVHEASNNIVDIHSQAHVSDSKMPSFPQPEKHHRVENELIPLQPPQSLDCGLGTETTKAELRPNLTHNMRVDKTSLKAAMKTKIKYPSSHDKVWTKINEELELILPSIFPDKIIKSSNPSDLSQKFDSWLHQFFLEKFGKAEKAKVSERKRSP